MKKYRLHIKEQVFRFEDFAELKKAVKELMDMGAWMLETGLISEEPEEKKEVIKVVGEKQKEKEHSQEIDRKKLLMKEEEARENLLNTEQKIKPIKIDTKLLKKKEIKLLEKEAKKVSTTKRKSKSKFPKEMEGFIKDNLDLEYDILVDKVNERFELNMSTKDMYDYLRYRKIKKKKVMYSDDPGLKSVKKEKKAIISDEKPLKTKQRKYPDEMEDFIKERIEGNSNKELVDLVNEKYNVNIDYPKLATYLFYKKIKRRPKSERYNPEAIQFIKENIKNFSNKEICRELKMRFNIKTVVSSLQNFMHKQGIRRESKSNIDPRIVNFIRDSKIKEAYALRDEIIIKFDKNLPMELIKGLMKKDLSGEGVKAEVKRIEDQREEFDESIDEMGLDD